MGTLDIPHRIRIHTIGTLPYANPARSLREELVKACKSYRAYFVDYPLSAKGIFYRMFGALAIDPCWTSAADVDWCGIGGFLPVMCVVYYFLAHRFRPTPQRS